MRFEPKICAGAATRAQEDGSCEYECDTLATRLAWPPAKEFQYDYTGKKGNPVSNSDPPR